MTAIGSNTNDYPAITCLYIPRTGGCTLVIDQFTITRQTKSYKVGGIQAKHAFFIQQFYLHGGHAIFFVYLFQYHLCWFGPFFCLVLKTDGICHGCFSIPRHYAYLVCSFVKRN